MNTILDFSNLSLVDLTHTLSPEVPSWSGGCGFQQEIISDYDEDTSATTFRVHSIAMLAGMGTHLDAPAHCIPGGIDIASISIQQLITPCVVIDVSSRADETYSVSVEDVQLFETNYGVINQNSLVIVRTGWDEFWQQPERYRNNLIFPTISIQAGELLLARNIAGLGIDTLSPDNPTSGFPVHQLILGAGKYIVENVANSALLPPRGAYTIALPLKIQGGTESPIRLIGVIAS